MWKIFLLHYCTFQLFSLGISPPRTTAFSVAAKNVSGVPSARRDLLRWRRTSKSSKVPGSDGSDEADVQALMRLASAHFPSQAVHALIILGVPDILGDSAKTIGEVASEMDGPTNEDALLRTMRLASSAGILAESVVSSRHAGGGRAYAFRLTSTGALLRTSGAPGRSGGSLAPVFRHWLEQPLWNAWNELPSYISTSGGTAADEGRLPFDRANGASADTLYGAANPASLRHANDFVRFISSTEETAVLNGFDWSSLSGKTVVDVGGHHGKVIGLVAEKFPDVRCVCLDLPEVVSSAGTPPPGVELVAGSIFDPETVPDCDVIFMKHFLDKCMWTKEETVRILRVCHSVLPPDGRVIIGEAVLPDDATDAGGTNGLHLAVDVLFLLVGRDAARTESEWNDLAERAGFSVETITATLSPSCYMTVLNKMSDADPISRASAEQS